MIDGVASVTDGDHAGVFQVTHYGNGLAAVTAERKEESVELFVIGVDAVDDIRMAFLRLF